MGRCAACFQHGRRYAGAPPRLPRRPRAVPTLFYLHFVQPRTPSTALVFTIAAVLPQAYGGQMGAAVGASAAPPAPEAAQPPAAAPPAAEPAPAAAEDQREQSGGQGDEADEALMALAQLAESAEAHEPPKRKRGRPRKVVPPPLTPEEEARLLAGAWAMNMRWNGAFVFAARQLRVLCTDCSSALR